MGKRHHSSEYKIFSNVYLLKLFGAFFLMNSLSNKNCCKEIDIESNQVHFDEENSEYTEDKSFNDNLFIPANTDSLMESYKKALEGDLEIPADKNSQAQNEQDDFRTEDCSASVISEIMPLCQSFPHFSEAAKAPVTVKIPVVLAECRTAVNIESSIKMQDNISEIKGSSKHVFINQCKLAPSFENSNPDSSLLFIDGFIRKNIEYCCTESSDAGNLKHTIVKIPFKCAVKVNFNTPPVFKLSVPREESEITDIDMINNNSCKNDKAEGNISAQSLKSTEILNEKVFCELISAEINGTEILEIKEDKNSPTEKNMPCITEKGVLILTIELLQKQHVKIS
ncbi:MAG: hypothetical protein LIR50_10660 [Bacillota bacterium]|nr:hypothetical protein [Bacillota bacterium]